MNTSRESDDSKAGPRISSTSWIGNVGGQLLLDDVEVNVEHNSRVGSSGELRLADFHTSSDSSNGEASRDLKIAADGVVDTNLKGDNDSKGPLHPSISREKSSSTHRSAARSSGGSRRRARKDRISVFTNHTTTTLVSSSYHSSELDSFSEDELSDSDLASSDDESLEASIEDDEEESRDGEDDIKSILSSDFDSCDLDLDGSNDKTKSSDDDSSLPESSTPPPQEVEARTPPAMDKRSKLNWTNEKRWATLETSPTINPDPFVSPQRQHSSKPMISNSSLLVQVDRTSNIGNPHKKMEVILQDDDEISLNDDDDDDVGSNELSDDFDDDDDYDKESTKKTVADVLERDPDSQHSSFLLEVGGIQRNVSGLTLQSGVGRSSTRTRRRGSKRTRKTTITQTLQNELWDSAPPSSPTQHALLNIPNQPLPPPPPRTETPSLPSPKSFTGAEIVTGSASRKRSSKTKWSHHSRVSALSTDEDEVEVEGGSNSHPNNDHHGNRSRSNSFESSWDSTIDPSPIVDKKKLRVMDGAESVGVRSHLTSADNPTFRAGNRATQAMDVPPPPPHRLATPRTSIQQRQKKQASRSVSSTSMDGRPQLVDMRSLSKASALTYDSKASTQTAKQRNRETLERLNDQMIAAIGVSSPGLTRSKSSRSNLSIGQRRDSLKRLREKLRNSFRHVVSSPATGKSRKTISPTRTNRKKLSPTTNRKTLPHRTP